MRKAKKACPNVFSPVQGACERRARRGFIIGGGGPTRVIVRAIGPSLGDAGVQGALQNPTLDLVNANGVVVRSNDNWKDSQRQVIEVQRHQAFR